MAIATKPKAKAVHHKKRSAKHHQHTKHYVKSYWPYLPMGLIVALGVFVNTQLNQPSAVLGDQSNFSQQALLASTNENRLENDRTNLSLNAHLQAAAQAKAEDMVSKNYWSHDTPSGQEPWIFVTNAGYQYSAAGENLAYGFDSATGITNAWMQSEAHRKNLLNSSFSEVGFGVAQSPDYLGQGAETVIVAMYGSPAVAGDNSLQTETNAPETMTPVSRLDTAAAPVLSGLALGIISTLAVILLITRHGIAWRKVLNRGEMFVINHPLLDIVMVMIATTAIILTNTAGFIN